jgi:hypothetical protein
MCTAAGWGWDRIRGCCRQRRGRGDIAICAHSRHQGRASRPHVSASNGPGAPAVPQQPTWRRGTRQPASGKDPTGEVESAASKEAARRFFFFRGREENGGT